MNTSGFGGRDQDDHFCGEIENEKSVQRRNLKDGLVVWNYDYPARDIAISKDKNLSPCAIRIKESLILM